MKQIALLGSALLGLLLSGLSCQPSGTKQPQSGNPDHPWWKETVVYQLYPRSFKDSDGDGVGDLKGIISKLDYIKSLGVDAVWLNPIYASPNDDNGYDISDYRAIMKDFGTMADFDVLLKGLHDRNIKLVMDLVVNHSSDEHEWFKQSRSARNNPYRNYYHWWNAERGKPNPRFSSFDVNHDAWKYDSLTKAYYLHYFSQKQPDLNWENPKLRQEVYGIMKFWLDKGIDGIRMDAFQFASKDTTFPVLPAGFEQNIIKYYGKGPHLHDYLQEMNREVVSKYNIMTVAEGAGSSFEDAHALVDPERHELNMAYHFEGMDVGNDPKGYSLLDFKRVYTRWDSAFVAKGWLAIFLGNHDVPRMVSKFGNDSPQFREASSKMLTTFTMTMRGTPYYFNGDELGMTNIRFEHIADYRDISAINGYKNVQMHGGDLNAYMENLKFISRDNTRTPFQWDNTDQAGFSTGTPWIKVNPNYTTVNAAAEEKDPNSCLNYFRKIVRFRKDNPVLIYGAYTLLDRDNPDVYAYTRTLDGKKMLVLLNFKDKPATVHTGLDLSKAKVLLGNYPSPSAGETLQPYEAMILGL
jgi:oligo-1,6-glucosidase